MELLILFLGLVLAFVCIAYEIYFIYAVVISRNCKYPPAFPSFGNMKRLCLEEARKVLNVKGKKLKIIDLGCGTGTLLLPLAKEFPEHEFVGYDWDWIICKIVKFRSKKLSNIKIICDNFMKADFEEYDLIMCFLDTRAAVDLSSKFKERLKPGTVVISSAFELKNLEPTRILDARSYGMPLKVFVYEI